MKKRMKALIMAVVVMAGSMLTSGMETVLAEESRNVITYVNPLYADVIDENDLNKPVSGVQAYASPTYEKDEAVLKAELKQAMMDRQENITIYYETRTELTTDFLNVWLEEICEHTGEATEGDYIRWHYAGYSYDGSYIKYSDGRIQYEIDIAFTYYTTAEQEAEVTEQVESLIEEWNITEGTSDYDKIKQVYDYVCENVTYDYDNLNNEEYTLKFSAYAALVHKTAICQGYGTLIYRILNEVDVDTRFVAGYDYNDVGHGWNLVEIDGTYYYIDATWDAGNEEYEYFLKGKKDFLKHTVSSNFVSEYPISDYEYVESEDVIVLPFTDVKEGSWYYDYVVWAYDNQVANGIELSDGTYVFEPDSNCTRAQFVQFMWNAFGTETQDNVENPFSDIEEDKWYYKSVIWAVENGITDGIKQADGRYIFQPDAVCTRAQAAQFIYNLLGKDIIAEYGSNPFTDIEEGKWYRNAVLWGYQNGIVSGIKQADGSFKYCPEDNVTRAQVVKLIKCASDMM